MPVRRAVREDLSRIVEIYDHYVLDGYSTFDEVTCPVEEWEPWFGLFDDSGRYRCLVATDGSGDVVGYACSRPYRDHPAFRDTVELSVYLDPGAVGAGVGSALYERLLDDLAPEGLHRAVVGIALPNDASVALHRRFGFTEVGVFDEYAVKADLRISSVWMQRGM